MARGGAPQPIELVATEENDYRTIYEFFKYGKDFPYVDVAFLKQVAGGSQRINATGPYMKDDTGNRLPRRRRPSSVSNIEIRTRLPVEVRQQVAASIAALVFEIQEVKQSDQEQE